MNSNNYPVNTVVSVRINQLYKATEKRRFHERMSSRMVKCASVLEQDEFVGWQMIVPKKGLVKMSLFGSKTLQRADLDWMAEKLAKTSKRKPVDVDLTEFNRLYEIHLPVAERGGKTATIGFTCDSSAREREEMYNWPAYYSDQFEELVKALQTTGAALRVIIGSASEGEKEHCWRSTIRTYDIRSIAANYYVGRPVKIRVFLRIPSEPSWRLKTIIEEAVQGAKLLYIGEFNKKKVINSWNDPLCEGRVLPDYAARILMMEPEICNTVVGIELCEEEAKKIPASHKNVKDPRAVVIGKAIDTRGIKRKITIGEIDLRRHYQIVGQTGTGKSTLLSTLILSAIERGHGLTFFDPHGSTIDTVLKSIPEQYADKVRVVHIGDVDNPVPLNIWDSGDPEKEERNISDLCELFSDIFDPRKEGIVGPRYERWLSTFAKASIALLGRRASLESIAVISQSQDNMYRVYKAIVDKYPDLAKIIQCEYGTDKGNDFVSTLNWYLCKFQRITSVEQLRKTLGAGTNALDFNRSIDTDTVTLIDLASPTIGTHAARIIGTLLMMKLWNAAMTRKDRDRTHLVVVDEASLFQTNPMPRMLAESRKFGISMVLCHQHTGQLTQEIREALEANSANFSAFRLSTKDAANAALRFDDPEARLSLPRLSAYNAITTLSINGQQTAPFNLETIRPKQQKQCEAITKRIEKQSYDRLIAPNKALKALTTKEILKILDQKSTNKIVRSIA